jgi:hypothetical protein
VRDPLSNSHMATDRCRDASHSPLQEGECGFKTDDIERVRTPLLLNKYLKSSAEQTSERSEMSSESTK